MDRIPGRRALGTSAALASLVGLVLVFSQSYGAEGATTASIKLYPAGTHTGVAAVDRVLDAMDASAVGELARLVKPFKVACTTKPREHPDRPRCKASEADGALVSVFNWASCEGVYLRIEKARETLRGFLGRVRGLYAVYRVPETGRHNAFAPAHGFGIVYAEGYGSSLVGKLLILGPRGTITAIHSGCSETPQRMLVKRAGTVLLRPRR